MINNTLNRIKTRMSDILPSLGGAEAIPDRFITRPVDMWNGNATNGELLSNGVFTLHQDTMQLYGECWEPVQAHENWLAHLHCFSWLRDLRAAGHSSARQQAQALIESWALQYTGPAKKGLMNSWRPEWVGERIALWIAHYDFFAADADDEFMDVFFASLYRQAQYLNRMMTLNLPQQKQARPRFSLGQKPMAFGMDHPYALQAVKGLLYSGIAFENHDMWVQQSLDYLSEVLRKNLLEDGMHVSRSAFVLQRFLKHLLEIRNALNVGDYPVPDILQTAIEKAACALRFFRYSDKYFSLFQGTLRGDITLSDSILAQAGTKGKRKTSLPRGGYEKITLGRSTLMMDCGPAAMHHAPLSFEFVHGKDRIFTNCGSHLYDERWQSILAAPAAHNTLDMPGIQGDISHYKIFDLQQHSDKKFQFLQAAHDAYLPEKGFIHRRSLYLCNDGYDLRGEDNLFAQYQLKEPHSFALRFHLHPRMNASITEDKRAILLRLPNGIGWRFVQEGGFLSLEDSLHSAEMDEEARKSQQIVVQGAVTDTQSVIKWALQREGV